MEEIKIQENVFIQKILHADLPYEEGEAVIDEFSGESSEDEENEDEDLILHEENIIINL